MLFSYVPRWFLFRCRKKSFFHIMVTRPLSLIEPLPDSSASLGTAFLPFLTTYVIFYYLRAASSSLCMCMRMYPNRSTWATATTTVFYRFCAFGLESSFPLLLSSWQTLTHVLLPKLVQMSSALSRKGFARVLLRFLYSAPIYHVCISFRLCHTAHYLFCISLTPLNFKLLEVSSHIIQFYNLHFSYIWHILGTQDFYWMNEFYKWIN